MVIEAYQNNDIENVRIYSKQFLDLVNDLDMLLACHDGFLLGPWLESAKNLAKDSEQEKQVITLLVRLLFLRTIAAPNGQRECNFWIYIFAV